MTGCRGRGQGRDGRRTKQEEGLGAVRLNPADDAIFEGLKRVLVYWTAGNKGHHLPARLVP